MDFLKLKALEYGMALVIGPLAAIIMQGLKAVSATIDALPPFSKRVAVLAMASLLTMLESWARVDFNCDPEAAVNCLATLDAEAVKAALAAAVAFLLHAAKKRRELKP